jgi:ketosteroid isomerase-like protein
MTKRALIVAFTIACVVCIPIAEFQTATAQTEDVNAVSSVLDALHEAASEADYDGYFSLYTDDAVFLGTDATERWAISEFKEYTRARFRGGTGWTYNVTGRNVFISDDKNIAWFDESLENVNMGATRGTGVLVKLGSEWKITQYNLTVPIPNDLAREFVATIRKHTGAEGG